MVKFKKTRAVSGKTKNRLTILAKRFFNFGGDKRDRTAGLLNAIQALSQAHRLHTPVTGAQEVRFNTCEPCIQGTTISIISYQQSV